MAKEEEMSQAATAERLPAKAGTKTVLDLLQDNKRQLQMALPKHLTPDRLIRVAWTAIRKNPRLLKCTSASLVSAVLECAQLGLVPDGVLGQAYLVPYWNNKIGAYEAQFQVGYKGLIALARQSGEISNINSRIVYANDEFEVEYGLNERLVHRPAMEGERGDFRAVYAVARFKDGGYDFEVMFKNDVDRIKALSKAKKEDSPWEIFFEEMSRKTPIRNLAKRLPLTVDRFQRAAALDEQIDAGVFPEEAGGDEPIDVTTQTVSEELLRRELDQKIRDSGHDPAKVAKHLKDFIARSAEGAEIAEAEVIQEALENFQEFWTCFLQWREKNAAAAADGPPDDDRLRELLKQAGRTVDELNQMLGREAGKRLSSLDDTERYKAEGWLGDAIKSQAAGQDQKPPQEAAGPAQPANGNISTDQLDQLLTRLQEAGLKPNFFLGSLNEALKTELPDLASLPAARFDEAMDQINRIAAVKRQNGRQTGQPGLGLNG